MFRRSIGIGIVHRVPVNEAMLGRNRSPTRRRFYHEWNTVHEVGMRKIVSHEKVVELSRRSQQFVDRCSGTDRPTSRGAWAMPGTMCYSL